MVFIKLFIALFTWVKSEYSEVSSDSAKDKSWLTETYDLQATSGEISSTADIMSSSKAVTFQLWPFKFRGR